MVVLRREFLLSIVVTLLLLTYLGLFPVHTPNVDASAESYTDWPMLGHDPAHAGFSTSNAPNTNETIWKVELSGYFGRELSSPVVSNGRVFMGSYGGVTRLAS